MADRVLVLGGSYFVGRKLVEFLTENGYAVTVLNRGTRPIYLSINTNRRFL